MKMQRQTTDKLSLIVWLRWAKNCCTIVLWGSLDSLRVFLFRKELYIISIPYHFPWVFLAPYRDRKQSVLTWIDKDELPWNNIRLPFNLLYNFLHKSTGLKHFWRKGIKVASHGAFIQSIFWHKKKSIFWSRKIHIIHFYIRK